MTLTYRLAKLKKRQMKRSALTVCVFVTLLVTSTLASEDRNGNWWRSQQKSVKAVYVVGMIDGVGTGEAILTKDGPTAALKAFTATADRLLVGAKAEQLMDGMDRFYSDFRNRSILTSHALFIVAMQISGATDEQIQNWTLIFRRATSAASAASGD